MSYALAARGGAGGVESRRGRPVYGGHKARVEEDISLGEEVVDTSTVLWLANLSSL